nr:MAG TPA_asm: hypothetical protein [Caudoviricetes sp.]
MFSRYCVNLRKPVNAEKYIEGEVKILNGTIYCIYWFL